MKSSPSFEFENEAPGIAAGCDEAGRGPLAGPVVAAAVIFRDRGAPDVLINDSKQLSVRQREAAYEWITANTIWAAAQCSAAEIDEMNILRASLAAMARAAAALSVRPDFVLVDGNKMPDGLAGRAIVKGDAKSFSIAAASIVAKVTRDRIMRDLALDFPQYGWERNSGYPTKEHYAAIGKFGPTIWHRRSFRLE
jgi:ribonuclease HII